MASSSSSRPAAQPMPGNSTPAASIAPDESVPSPARRRLRALLAEQRRRSQQREEPEASSSSLSPQPPADVSSVKKRTASQAGLMSAVDERDEVLSPTALAAARAASSGARTPLARSTYGRTALSGSHAPPPAATPKSFSPSSSTELTSLRNLLRERDDQLAALTVELEESKEQWRSAGEKWRRAVEAEKRERQRREEVEAAAASSESTFQAERHRLTSELHVLRNSSATLAADRASLESAAEAESAALKLELEQCRRQRDELLGYRDQAHRLFESEGALRRQLEDARARLAREASTTTCGPSTSGDDSSLRPELRRQAQALAALEKQNSVLRDEVTELRRRRDDAELARGEAKEIDRKWREKYRILQEECDQARREVDSLTTVFPRADVDVTTTTSEDVIALRHKLSALSAAHAPCGRAVAAQKAATAELARKLEDVSGEAQAELARLAQVKEEAERERRWEHEAKLAAERRLAVAYKELDGLRALSLGSSSSTSTSAPSASLVASLESQLEVYRRTLDDLRSDTRDIQAQTIQELDLVKRSELDDALGVQRALEEQLAAATRAHEEMESELVDLHRRVGSGEYNAEVWRVVELRDNPAARDRAIRKQALDELRAENQALLDQIVEIEAGANVVAGSVPRETYDRIVRDSTAQEAAHAKRLQRLKEIFGSKSKEFLESVYSLLGWRIKFDENGTDVRLQSMYAPKGKMGLTIKFSSTEGHFGTMQMTGAMAKSLGDARRYWIEERQSVPGFLAQVTLEVFEKTTIGRLAGYVANEEVQEP